jgi:hypothetical protein
MYRIVQQDLFLHVNPDSGRARTEKSPKKNFRGLEQERMVVFYIWQDK